MRGFYNLMRWTDLLLIKDDPTYNNDYRRLPSKDPKIKLFEAWSVAFDKL